MAVMQAKQGMARVASSVDRPRPQPVPSAAPSGGMALGVGSAGSPSAATPASSWLGPSAGACVGSAGSSGAATYVAPPVSGPHYSSAPDLFTVTLLESAFTPVIGKHAALLGGPVERYTAPAPEGSNPDAVLALVEHRKQAWRSRISAMARTTVRVLDFGNLPKFDSFGHNLEFHLHTIRTLFKAANILKTLPLPVESLYRLASSDEPNLPMPPDMFINNRHGHVIISDSAKGTKPGKKLVFSQCPGGPGSSRSPARRL
jgi:hypothetical protein